MNPLRLLLAKFGRGSSEAIQSLKVGRRVCHPLLTRFARPRFPSPLGWCSRHFDPARTCALRESHRVHNMHNEIRLVVAQLPMTNELVSKSYPFQKWLHMHGCHLTPITHPSASSVFLPLLPLQTAVEIHSPSVDCSLDETNLTK